MEDCLMKCKKLGSHMISYQFLLLSTIMELKTAIGSERNANFDMSNQEAEHPRFQEIATDLTSVGS